MTGQTDLSLFESFVQHCPLCGVAFEGHLWRIVDADQRPNLVVHAKDNSLQRSFCPRCIGPGVEHAGSFCIVRRAEGKLQWHSFLFGEASQLQADAELLRTKVMERCKAAGIEDESIQHLGSRWVEGPSQVEESLEDTWPELSAKFDPAMLAGPLLVLLNAGSAAERAAALKNSPDLARPNMEILLSRMAEQDNESRGIAALRVLYFNAAARSLGLDQATHQAEAEEARIARLSALPAPLRDRLSAFLSSRPDPAQSTPLAFEKEAMALGAALDESGVPDAKAEVWLHVAGWLRQRPDVQDSMPLAVRAYGLALNAVEPERAATVHRLLLGLSSVWDLRKDGNRSANVERALECATAARDYARSLPVDQQAEAAMEQGILYVDRPTGDPSSNLTLAREALTFAINTALRSELRMLARYNLGLADIEDPDEDNLARGIARLESLAAPDVYELFFDQAQQQNLFQSLGVALAKRAASAADSKPENLDRAAEFIGRALTIARARNAAHDVAFLAGILALVETDRRVRGLDGRDLADIISLLDEAGSALSPEKAPTDYARNELRRARVLMDLCDPQLASEMVAQALTNACRFLTPESHPDLCRRAQSQLAELRFREKDFKAAAAAFAVACEASDHVYGQTESVTERAGEVKPNANLYAGLVDSLAHLAGDDADVSWSVLEAMESGRARLTLDLMGLRPLPPFPGIPEDLLEREAQLISELAWTVPGAASDLVRDDPDRLRHQRATQAELTELWGKIALCGEGGKRYASLRHIRPPGREQMAAFAAQLGPRAAIACFFVLQDRVLLVWLRAGSAPRIDSLTLPAAVLREHWIGLFRRDVLDPPSEDNPRHEWLALGELLFATTAQELADLELLALIPHQDLHMLPLHALSVGGKPLIEQVPVVYGPSLGILDSIVEADFSGRMQGTALVASNAMIQEEADEFEGEADAVAHLLGTQAQHHAQRQGIAAAAPSAGIIHLVCHGYFDAQNPLDSGLVLADGVMRARDWLTLSLHADLVSLSACETGRQQIQIGDELSGLARTLLQAGSSSVLLTLWRVYSDAAAEWMSFFYVLPPGTSSLGWAKPFQRATMQLRARDADPRAWAPFVLIGDARVGRSQRPNAESLALAHKSTIELK